MKKTLTCLGMALIVSLVTAFGQTAQAQQTVVSSAWLVDLRTVCAVGGIVFVGVWRISTFTTRVTDRLKEGELRFERVESWLAQLDRKLGNLPCGPGGRCDEKRKERDGR